VNTSHQFGGCAAALWLAATLNCAAYDQIRVYSVPKEPPAASPAQTPAQAPAQAPAQTQPTAGAQDIPVNASPIHWTVPAGWEEKPADGFRRGSFAIKGAKGGQADVAITSFPGSVGTELDNVNRWRRELSMEEIGAGEIASEPVTVDSTPGKLYDLTGKEARTVVAMIPRNGSSWFIKLRGETAAVAAAKPAFLEFLKSVHFGGEGEQATLATDATPRADPHAGLGLQGVPVSPGELAAPTTASDAPKWTLPAQWTETAPRSTMIFKSFAVSGDAGAKADITVSFLQGEGGGVLANVNRWRGQLGQPQIDQDQLDGVLELVATAEGKATLVDFMGTDAKSGQPARLVAAIVPHGEMTWFYKLMGNGKVVGGQKDSFVQFVKTVHYP
jgi:hypothetical protein